MHTNLKAFCPALGPGKKPQVTITVYLLPQTQLGYRGLYSTAVPSGPVLFYTERLP